MPYSRPFLRAAGSLLAASVLLTAPRGPAVQAQQPAAKTPAKSSIRPVRKTITETVPALPAPVKVTEVEGITEYLLGNGLRVLLFPDQSKPTVTVNMTYLVGSRHEGYGETGMAHLLEHMVFKGTPKHANIPQELTDHGARPNGSTWYDRTNYFETVPATDVNVDWALDLEADRMVNSYIAKKDLMTEFSVVRNEYESGENSPFNVLMERTLSTAYIWHNYGKSTIGARSDLEAVPIERLQAFYRKYYQPDNAVLMVAGKFDPPSMLARVNATYGAIPKPVRSLDRGNMLFPTYTREPVQDGERSVTLRRVGDVQVVMMAYHVPASGHPDFAAVDVLSSVLGEAPAGRLYKALVETKKAASVGAFSQALAEPGPFLLFANVRNTNSLDSAQLAMDQVIARLVTDSGVTAAEVERVKATEAKNVELLLNNTTSVGLGLSEYIAAGDWRLLFLHRDRIQKVSAADVNRVARQYLKPANRTLGLFVPTDKPDRAEVPEAGDVVAMVKDYKGNVALVAGEAFDPSPSNVDSRTLRSALSNGMKLALLPKKTRGESVIATVTLRYGSAATLANLGATPGLASGMLSRGTKTKSRQELREAFDKLKARWSVGGGSNNTVARLETTRPNLVPALRLLSEVLQQPAFDAKEFDELKAAQLAGIEQSKSEPVVQASVAMQKRLQPFPKGSFQYVNSPEESAADLRAATVDQAKAFHAGFFGASYATLAIVGDFDATDVRGVALELFGGWKSPKPFERALFPYVAMKDTAITLDTPDKANAFYMLGTNIALKDDDPDYAAMLLANHIMGGGFLNSRLAVRIRQKEGISYGIGSGLQVRSLDKSGSWMGQAIYNPTNVVRLEQAFKQELDSARARGFTDAEVTAAKAALVQQRQQSRSNDGELVAQLNNQAYLGRTTKFDGDLEARINALSAAEVSDAFRKYVKTEHLVIVRAGDFKSKGIDPDKPVTP